MLKNQFHPGLEAGTDEAGRGCLAGPVTAAAVILPESTSLTILNDSKQLTAEQRYALRPQIESQATAFAVAHVPSQEIDKINILNASIKAMHLALDQLKIKPTHIVIDGNRFKNYKEIPFRCIVKGDGKYRNIAAASVLAKTYRDDFMLKIDVKHPEYLWKQNKGYPTKVHRNAILKYGETPYHRKSFQLRSRQFRLQI